MSNQDPLLMASAAFEQWRHDRRYNNERTPRTLRQQAVALLELYPSATITSALHITTTQLTRWRGMAGKTVQYRDNAELAGHEFVSLPLDNIPDDVSAPDTLCLTLLFASGHQLKLSGAISASMLSALVQQVKS
jgi:hypothetical protein